ncbi:GWT1-domain-containing protein [Roridomyces roridus]|uniref:GPI-anchored wall transfer protein n=1 Tax=Roridomyces roridus TaxID=1738132 RepID=A0AAD7C874_9AGAR|nr:GWT1-domain-containing protein [Roridomyces roridus]
MDDYKAFKEASVSGLTGSTVTHVNLISSVALVSIALYSTLQTRVYGARTIPFLVSFILLPLPLLLSMTIFANTAAILALLLLVPTAYLYARYPPLDVVIPLPSARPSSTQPPSSGMALVPAITTYRSHMMLMTVLGILAVDFPVFPRALAKCESYGVSLMDLGVGSFVFSNGVVSAIPLLKDSRHLSAPILPKLGDVLRRTIPIIALGLIRVLLVKGTEYPEHETEYGTHWNFFLTLALLPIFQVLLHPLIRTVPASMLGLGVGAFQQIALSLLGLKRYVQTAPRVDLISANKEGIASLIGYLSIHLLGLAMGTLVLPPSPSFFRRLRSGRAVPGDLGMPRQNDKTAIELASYAIVWWVLLGLSSVLGVDEGVSRQTANLPYALWIAAFNTSFILGYLTLDMVFFPGLPHKKPKPSSTAPASGYSTPGAAPPPAGPPPARAPLLLEAINKNALPLFLLANLGTGLVNLSMRTMYAGTVMAMGVLSLYTLVICGVAWGFRRTRVWRL